MLFLSSHLTVETPGLFVKMENLMRIPNLYNEGNLRRLSIPSGTLECSSTSFNGTATTRLKFMIKALTNFLWYILILKKGALQINQETCLICDAHGEKIKT